MTGFLVSIREDLMKRNVVFWVGFAAVAGAFVSPAMAQNARREQTVYTVDPYGAGVRDRSINSPGSVPIDNRYQIQSCNTSREQVPAAGGGLVWRSRTDCTNQEY